MQSKIKKDTVKAMQKVMNNSTFYPDSQQYDLVAMEVQGKPNVDKCKEDYDVFVVVHREVRILMFWIFSRLAHENPFLKCNVAFTGEISAERR